MNAAICDAARTLFDQHGYHGVHRRDVCRAAGIGLPTLNNYFSTKEGLVIAAYAPYVQTVIETIETSTEMPDVKVREFVTGLSAALRDHPAMVTALLPPRNTERDEEFAVTIQQLAEFLGALLGQCGINSELELGLSNAQVAEFGLFGLVGRMAQYPDGSHLDATELTLDTLFANL
jgi:AcrR family transcriptional regulator